jgi:hypothetical protein
MTTTTTPAKTITTTAPAPAPFFPLTTDQAAAAASWLDDYLNGIDPTPPQRPTPAEATEAASGWRRVFLGRWCPAAVPIAEEAGYYARALRTFSYQVARLGVPHFVVTVPAGGLITGTARDLRTALVEVADGDGLRPATEVEISDATHRVLLVHTIWARARAQIRR